jgi:SAM-dependent methyltransferase
LSAQVEILSDVKADEFPFDWYAIAREDHFWFRSRMDAFFSFSKKFVSLKEPLDVLEIGCGNGLVRRQIEKKSSWKTEGADISLDALKLNTGLKGKTYLYNIHEKNPGFENRFDVVILFDVLEHIPDTQAFLASCLFHLKKGGFLFLNVPALNQYKSDYDKAVGHIRRYNKKMMEKEFAPFDAEVAAQRYWALSLVPALVLRKKIVRQKGDIKAVVEKGLNPPNKLINSILYCALKAENTLFRNPFTGASLMTAVKKR